MIGSHPTKQAPDIRLVSLDLFWLDHLYQALSTTYSTSLLSTWSLKRRYGWQDASARNVFPLHYALQLYKMHPSLRRNGRTYLDLCQVFDWAAAAQLPPSVQCLGYLSGCGLHTARRARRKGAVIVIECGSTHPDFQHEVVAAEYSRNGLRHGLFPEAYRQRVKTEFAEADFIHVPSGFVAQTFLERGFPPEKLLTAPYGVDLNRFQPPSAPPGEHPFRIICPSGVNLRKGARILAHAWRKLGWKDAELHWIGCPGPETAPLFTPALAGIVFHSHLPHHQLAALYQSCHLFILPSFEEGLARVMLEAAACGLPLVVTPNTGAETFFSSGHPEGWLVETGSVDAVCAALEQARSDPALRCSKGAAAHRRAQAFSWDAYGAMARANYAQALRSAGHAA